MKRITKELKITFDETVDAGYMYLQDIEPGGVKYTYPVIIPENECMFNIDMDEDKRIIGFEFVGMKNTISKAIIDELEK